MRATFRWSSTSPWLAEQDSPTTHTSADWPEGSDVMMIVAGLPLNLAFSTSCTTWPGENRPIQPASLAPARPVVPVVFRKPEVLSGVALLADSGPLPTGGPECTPSALA